MAASFRFFFLIKSLKPFLYLLFALLLRAFSNSCHTLYKYTIRCTCPIILVFFLIQFSLQVFWLLHHKIDVVCIVIKVKELNGEGRSRRREVIVTSERYDRKILTLWGDLAEIEGELLESIENSKPVVAFCDVKSSIYQDQPYSFEENQNCIRSKKTSMHSTL
nr:uncharacterized protein LOC117278297 [Nicotiana tomentosiformis]